MNQLANLLSFLLLCFVFLFSSCTLFEGVDEIKAPNWEPDVAVPLVSSKISIQKILDNVDTDDMITTGPDGQITMVYSDEVLEVTAENVVKFPDVSFPVIFNDMKVPIPATGDAQINSMELKEGNITYEFTMAGPDPVELVITLPNFSLNGVPLVETRTFNTGGPQSVTLDMNGYSFDLSSDSIQVMYEAKLVNSGLPLSLLDLEMSINRLDYSYADGNLGGYDIQIDPQEIVISIFKNIKLEGILLENPMITFHVQNSFGVPVGAMINQMDFNTKTKGTVALQSQVVDDPILFAYPEMGEVGMSKMTDIKLNGMNSNLSEILEGTPRSIQFDMEAGTDPDGDNAVFGFVTDSSKINVSVDLELPLNGTISGVSILDTVEVEINPDDLDMIRSASVKMITENEIPLGGTLQAYMLDEFGAVIDSLFSGPQTVIAASEVDANGKTVASGNQTLVIDFSEKRKFDNLKRTRKIIMSTVFTSSGNGAGPVKILENYSLGIKLGIIAGLSVN